MVIKALMLGVGHFSPSRKIVPLGIAEQDVEWTTLDINPECKADIVYDLEGLECGGWIPRPDASFDEIHAYQVLEHFGRLGDYKGLFATFREFWRLLKPSGVLVGDTPALHSPWLFGDPGHCRVILPQTLLFLTRKCYEGLGVNTSTDYRAYVNPNWWVILHSAIDGDRHGFVLKKTI